MRATLLSRSLLLSFALAAAACGGAQPSDDDGASSTELAIPDGETAITSLGKADGALPAPATDDRLYFDEPAYSYVTDEYPLATRAFRVKGGRVFSVKVSALVTDGDAVDTRNPSGYKLYYLDRVRGALKWVYVTTIDGRRGVARASFRSSTDRTLLVTATANNKPARLRFDLSCASSNRAACALGAQPGDGCGGHTIGRQPTCDDGLFCKYADDAICGWADAPGVCTIPSPVCPRIYFPVCGCDGNTYGNACEANAHSMSVQHAGECGCDETAWSTGLARDVVGTWQEWDGARYTYTFNSDGTVQSTNEAACLFAPTPCRIATRMNEGRWAWDSTGTKIEITWNGGANATFEAQSNCRRDSRLVGNDWGVALTLLPQ